MNSSVMIKVREFIRPEAYKNVIHLSESRNYIIPEYQREIRWKPENAKILLEDLLLDAKFLGTVFISTKTGSLDYDLIDGQQRVTVLFMIYWAMARVQNNPNAYITCKYTNRSYLYLYNACEVDFDLNLISDRYGITNDDFEQMDFLEQTEKFKLLWKTIYDIINSLTPKNRAQLKNHIEKSEINLICNVQNDFELDNKICVNYFLDINDRAVHLDDLDIFKGYLFKKDFENMTNRWSNLQKKLKNLRGLRLYYPLLSVLEHYILCNTNKKLEYKIKKIQHFKITKDVYINGDEYKEGRHILDLINEPDYSKHLMDDIDEYLDFIKNVLENNKGYAACFSKYFKSTSGGGLDSYTRDNCISLIRSILLNDNVVPKLLVTKYFFERLQNTRCSKVEFKDIYYVYYCCTMFSLIDSNKASASFVRIAMDRDWSAELKKKATSYLDKAVWSGCFSRKIEKKDTSPEIGGMYFPKDVACVYSHFNMVDVGKFNEKNIYTFINDVNKTVEHFFINKSYKYRIKYGTDKTVIVDCPVRLKKYVSYVGNYLYIDLDANKEMGNAPVWEKVAYLDKYMNDHSSLGCEFADVQFGLIKICFNEFPDMNQIDTEERAIEEFSNYYSEFENRYKKYMELIKNEKNNCIC